MNITLIRNIYTEAGTFGVLVYEKRPFAVTLENPWYDNEPFKSCIPSGQYTATRCRNSAEYNFKDSPRYGDTFVVDQVEGRSKILFHVGNLEENTEGCILVGSYFGMLAGKPAVLNSGKAFKIFRALTAGMEWFNFDIVDHSIFAQSKGHLF